MYISYLLCGRGVSSKTKHGAQVLAFLCQLCALRPVTEALSLPFLMV